MGDRLKRCPFCRTSDGLHAVLRKWHGHKIGYVECDRCLARGPTSVFPTHILPHEAMSKLRAKWNALLSKIGEGERKQILSSAGMFVDLPGKKEGS